MDVKLEKSCIGFEFSRKRRQKVNTYSPGNCQVARVRGPKVNGKL